MDIHDIKIWTLIIEVVPYYNFWKIFKKQAFLIGHFLMHVCLMPGPICENVIENLTHDTYSLVQEVFGYYYFNSCKELKFPAKLL